MQNCKQELQSIYVELHHLAESSAEKENLSGPLQRLAQVIEQLPDNEESLRWSDQLRSGLAKFETEHPTLARTAEDLIDSLARLGI